SCCAFGSERMANVWMHNGFLQVESQKMSKSLGNFVTIHELLRTETFGRRRWPGEVLRLAMLMTHYRQPIDFTASALIEAERTLDGWYRAVGDVEAADVSCDDTIEALSDDLNTSKAIAGLHEFRAEASKGSHAAKQALKRGAALLGLLNQTESAWTAGKVASAGVDSEAIETLIATRLAHIAAKDWPAADRVRDELLAQGIQLKDGKDPATGARVTTWEVKR
ncbi:DALR domain-containing protein, partial [Rhizobiaceae sp. 2RAB30]